MSGFTTYLKKGRFALVALGVLSASAGTAIAIATTVAGNGAVGIGSGNSGGVKSAGARPVGASVIGTGVTMRRRPTTHPRPIMWSRESAWASASAKPG